MSEIKIFLLFIFYIMLKLSSGRQAAPSGIRYVEGTTQ